MSTTAIASAGGTFTPRGELNEGYAQLHITAFVVARVRLETWLAWPRLCASSALAERSVSRRHCSFGTRAATAAVVADPIPLASGRAHRRHAYEFATIPRRIGVRRRDAAPESANAPALESRPIASFPRLRRRIRCDEGAAVIMLMHVPEHHGLCAVELYGESREIVGGLRLVSEIMRELGLDPQQSRAGRRPGRGGISCRYRRQGARRGRRRLPNASPAVLRSEPKQSCPSQGVKARIARQEWLHKHCFRRARCIDRDQESDLD